MEVHQHIYNFIKGLELKHCHVNKDASIFFQRMWDKKHLTKREAKNYWQSPRGKIDKGLSDLQQEKILTLGNVRLIKEAINVELNGDEKNEPSKKLNR
jgi:hypothetical protein